MTSDNETRQLPFTNCLHDHIFQYAHNLAKKFYFDVLHKQRVLVPALDDDAIVFSRQGWEHFEEKSRSKLNLLSRYAALPKVLPLLTFHDAEIGYEQRGDREFWAFRGIVDDVLVKAIIRSIENGPKHFYSCVWQGDQQSVRNENRAVSRLYPRCRGVDTPQLYEQCSAFLHSLSNE